MQENKMSAVRTRGRIRRKKELKDYTQDFIPIKNIANGVIETTDGRYLTIVEILPINFLLLSNEGQIRIIAQMAQWFKISNIKFQFKSITKKADSEKYIAHLKEEIERNGEKNEKTRAMIKSYIKLVRSIGNNEALTRRFFLILEYEPQSNATKMSATYADIVMNIRQAVAKAESYLYNCGNLIVKNSSEDIAIGEILYIFFNRKSSLEEPFNYRRTRVRTDTQMTLGNVISSENDPVNIPVVDFIAPRGLDLSHINYCIMDGLYYTFLYIKADGYPSSVGPAWLSPLVNMTDGVDVDIFFEKQNKSSTLDNVNRKIRLNRSKMKETDSTASDFEEVQNSIGSGYFIKDAMVNGNEDLFFMSTIITISAPTYKELRMKKDAIIDYMKSQDIHVGDFRFIQDLAMKSVMPLLQINKKVFAKSKRNILTVSAAASYMFTSFQLCDDSGILLGVNEHNNSLCILDVFNAKKYNNANMIIMGTPGSGKSFTEQLMALRMRIRGIQCFIIAPLKGYEFKRSCITIGGQYIKLCSGSPHCINIMEIRPYENLNDKFIDGIDETIHTEESFLAKKVDQLKILFSLMIPDMTSDEKQDLDDELLNIYASYGIVSDNESLYDDVGNIKKMPTLADLYFNLVNKAKTLRLATAIKTYAIGNDSSFGKQTNVDLSNKFVVIDISELKGASLIIGMFIALDYVWDRVKEDRTKKKAIFIDETWRLIGGSSNAYAANFVLEVFKIIRGYGGSAIAATQDLNDFFSLDGGAFGKGIINACTTKLVLKLEINEARNVKDQLQLSDNEYNKLTTFKQGHGLLISNQNKVPIEIRASDAEAKLITTDREQLLKIAQENQSK